MAFLYHIFTCHNDTNHWTLYRSFGDIDAMRGRAYWMRQDGACKVRTYRACRLADARRHVREAPDHHGRDFTLRDDGSALMRDLRELNWDWD